MTDEDVRIRNVNAVEAMYQAERDRDLGVWAALWSSSGRQTFPTMGADATVTGLAALRDVTREKFATRPPYGIDAAVDALVDPTLVLARLRLDYPGNPPIYLWCLFHFDDQGLITEVEEIFDRGTPAIAGS
ncbi:MAG TPA: nuclear transport factor 2 family protein [Propionicimonas sp.]|uniref:nuclear transport factor 2 family protein n=1 Tax=Propionicimonas sp. TaxID=1955623 RepID=UPI002F41A254